MSDGQNPQPPQQSPQPQNCSQCHNDVPAAMESVRESLKGVEAGLPSKLFPKDVRTVLEALERHHAEQ